MIGQWTGGRHPGAAGPDRRTHGHGHAARSPGRQRIEADLLAAASPLADRLLGFFQPDGRIAERLTGPADHDFLPGAVLLALARYWKASGKASGDRRGMERLDGAFEWYRRRFRMLQPWGMVGWQPRAWTALYGLTRNPEHAAFVFEVADWALDWQHERTGAFINDLHPAGPSFHTAFLIEGIADAWALAQELGDDRRARLTRARGRRRCASSTSSSSVPRTPSA